MKINTRFLCVLALLLCVVPALLCALVGCGSGSDSAPEGSYPPVPTSASLDVYRPNYAGDLTGMYYFPQETITYRILRASGATAINLVSIPSQAPTDVQAGDIRGAFQKIEAALADNSENHRGRRRFVEVAASDTSAAIDVVVQSRDQFGSVGEADGAGVPLGRTDLYYPGGRTSPQLGRSVVRLAADQPERSFRRTALHESLHAVGVWGHSRHYGVTQRHVGDVLVPVALPIIPTIELSVYDVHTLQASYDRTAFGQYHLGQDNVLSNILLNISNLPFTVIAPALLV